MTLPLSKTAPYAVVGIILSLYAVYVEHKVAHKSPDEEFTALCDIETLNASCRWVISHCYFVDVGHERIGSCGFSYALLYRLNSDGFPSERGI